MRLVEQISDDVKVAEFLKAEFYSKRFGSTIRKVLADEPISKITNPDVNSEVDNHFRKWLFGEVRGYGRNCDLFENIPSQVKWDKAAINKEELKSVILRKYAVRE